MWLVTVFSPNLLVNGLVTGLILTSMIGPITLTILRYGVVVDHRAGMAVAAGTWVSDVCFILPTYALTAGLEQWLEGSGVRSGLYIIGGLGLLAVGVLLMRKTGQGPADLRGLARRRYGQAFVAGFLVNSLSPFTLFFWLGVAVFLRAGEGWAGWYYLGVMLALVAGDTTKAWLSPRLAARIAAHRFRWLEVAAGGAVILSGGFVLVKGLVGF